LCRTRGIRNYFLDFVLIVLDAKGNQSPQSDTESTRYELPKTKEVRGKKRKIRNAIEQKIKKLKSKRDSKRRAKKTLQKNIDKFSVAVQKVEKAKRPSTSANARAIARKQFLSTTKLIEKYYAEGKLTKNQYDKALEKIFREFNEK
jgi:membrane-bound lytic murein transglycosylase B